MSIRFIALACLSLVALIPVGAQHKNTPIINHAVVAPRPMGGPRVPELIQRWTGTYRPQEDEATGSAEVSIAPNSSEIRIEAKYETVAEGFLPGMHVTFRGSIPISSFEIGKPSPVKGVFEESTGFRSTSGTIEFRFWERTRIFALYFASPPGVNFEKKEQGLNGYFEKK